MSYIKKYQRFVEELSSAPAKPDVKPGTTEKPGTAPGKPSPFRRNRPSEEPGPKAKKATEKDVASRFIDLMNDKGESIEKYVY